MIWITLTANGKEEFLDAASFIIKEDSYTILLMDGTIRTGLVSDIQFLHIEYSGSDN